MKAFGRLAWRFIVRWHVYFLLIPFYLFIIKEYCTKQSAWRFMRGRKPTKVMLLALHQELFRGDLSVLSEQPGFTVFCIKQAWQVRLVMQFYPADADGNHYYHPNSYPGGVEKAQAACRSFMSGFLKRLYRKLPVNGLLMANVRFLPDLDWGYISEQQGVPYFLFFREGLLNTTSRYNTPLRRHRHFGRFQGSHIVVHNEVSKRMFLESGFATEDQVSIGGALRMDNFIKKIKEHAVKRPDRLKVVLFYFPRKGKVMGEDDRHHIYRDTHLALLELAGALPEVDFVIKTKSKLFEFQLEKHLYPLYSEAGRDWRALPNLSFLWDIEAQELILEASVVLGFDSTTMLEAGIAGKPVILPYFKNLRDSTDFKFLGYRDHSHLFDLADDKASLKRLVQKYLNGSAVEDSRIQGRRQLFEEFFSSFQGNATEKYVSVIHEILRI